MPAFASLIQIKKPFEATSSAIILPSLWAISTALSAGTGPDRTGRTAAAAAAAAAHAADAADAADAATDAADAAAAAAYAYAYDATDAAAAAHVYAAAAYTDADAAAEAAAGAVTGVTAIQNGMTAKALAFSPLWPNNVLPPHIGQSWETLKPALTNLNENWSVWINWYEHILEGGSRDPDLEISRINFPTKDYTNAKVLNSKIKALYENTEEIPLQNPIADTFDNDEQGRIRLSSPVKGQSLENTPDQKSWYDELYFSVHDLAKISPNQLGHAATPVIRLASALPENIKSAQISIIWSRANALRILLARHTHALKNTEFSFDKMDEITSQQLTHIVQLFNNLAIGDNGLRQAEEISFGPQEEKQIEHQETLLKPIIADVIAQDIVTENAVDRLSDIQKQNEIMGRENVPDRLQRAQNHRTNSNFIAAAIKTLRDWKDVIIIADYSRKFLSWAAKNKDKIIEFVTVKWPNYLEVIKQIFSNLL